MNTETETPEPVECKHEWRYVDSRDFFYCPMCKAIDDAD